MVTYSLVTTNYNKADTLDESIRSLLANMTADMELIVVDGGSTDGSYERLRELSRRTEHTVQVFRKPSNLGEGRQVALERANGDIIVQQVDTDARYQPFIPLLLDLFHRVEASRGEDAVLITFDSLFISRRETALDVGGYPPLARVEEYVFFNRIVEHATPVIFPAIISEEITLREDTMTPFEQTRLWVWTLRDLTRVGFSAKQIVRFHHHEFPVAKALVADLLLVPAMIAAIGMDRFVDRRPQSWTEIESWQNALLNSEWGRDIYRRSLYPRPGGE